jgi:hypothetical protein
LIIAEVAEWVEDAMFRVVAIAVVLVGIWVIAVILAGVMP